MTTLQDEQARALQAIYPGPEKSVTALLQRYRADQNWDDWEDYVTGMHAVALISGQPRTHFVDAQYQAWSVL